MKTLLLTCVALSVLAVPAYAQPGPKPEFKDLPDVALTCEVSFTERMHLVIKPSEGIVQRTDATPPGTHYPDFRITRYSVEARSNAEINEFGHRREFAKWGIGQIRFGRDAMLIMIGQFEASYTSDNYRRDLGNGQTVETSRYGYKCHPDAYTYPPTIVPINP